MRVLIAGGGIGGLATALALRRVGLDTLACEQAPEIREVGAGITIWSNAVRVLRALDLETPVTRLASRVERSRTISDTGRTLAETDIAEFSAEAGAPSLCIHRADLQNLLREQLPPDSIRTNTRIESFRLDGTRVIARAGTEDLEADLLIGADGIHSTVRTQLHGNLTPRKSGSLCLRGIAEGEWLEPGLTLLATGPGAQAGLFPCGAGRYYWFTSSQTETDFTRWPQPFPQVMAATPPGAILRNEILDRPPIRNWGQGPVTLLGDAAHPTTPNLGQGACMALEDAITLASFLARSGDPVARLRAWEESRYARTAWITNESWRTGKMLQMTNPLAIKARNAFLGHRLAAGLTRRLFRQMLEA